MKTVFKVTVEFKVTVDDETITGPEALEEVRSTIQDGLKLPGYMTRGMDVEMFVPVRVARVGRP